MNLIGSSLVERPRGRDVVAGARSPERLIGIGAL